jgi:hypothetical protein
VLVNAAVADCASKTSNPTQPGIHLPRAFMRLSIASKGGQHSTQVGQSHSFLAPGFLINDLRVALIKNGQAGIAAVSAWGSQAGAREGLPACGGAQASGVARRRIMISSPPPSSRAASEIRPPFPDDGCGAFQRDQITAFRGRPCDSRYKRHRPRLPDV